MSTPKRPRTARRPRKAAATHNGRVTGEVNDTLDGLEHRKPRRSQMAETAYGLLRGSRILLVQQTVGRAGPCFGEVAVVVRA
jgi:hypothetical protein